MVLSERCPGGLISNTRNTTLPSLASPRHDITASAGSPQNPTVGFPAVRGSQFTGMAQRLFRDRLDAGRALAGLLEHHHGQDGVVVLGLLHELGQTEFMLAFARPLEHNTRWIAGELSDTFPHSV
jgi:hypothetical protein